MKQKLAVALGALAALLLLSSAAEAHVTFTPPFANAGERATLHVVVPNERDGHATVGVVMTVPPGFEVVAASSPPNWSWLILGATVSWQGSRLRPGRQAAFSVSVTPKVRAGTYAFRFEQRYDDDEVVRWRSDLNVLPATGDAAPVQHPWPAIAAGAIGLVVIAASLVGMHLFRRRRTLHER